MFKFTVTIRLYLQKKYTSEKPSSLMTLILKRQEIVMLRRKFQAANTKFRKRLMLRRRFRATRTKKYTSKKSPSMISL